MTQAAAPQQLQQKSVVELQREIGELRHALLMVHQTLSREIPTITSVYAGVKNPILLCVVSDNLLSALRTMTDALK